MTVYKYQLPIHVELRYTIALQPDPRLTDHKYFVGIEVDLHQSLLIRHFMNLIF